VAVVKTNPLVRATLLGVFAVMLSCGCAGQRVSKIGQMSEKPMVTITVGTTIEIRLPAIEYVGDDSGGGQQ